MTVIEINADGTARIIREDDGSFSIQRAAVGRWFTVIRNPQPFFADNRENETPEDSARRALAII